MFLKIKFLFSGFFLFPCPSFYVIRRFAIRDNNSEHISGHVWKLSYSTEILKQRVREVKISRKYKKKKLIWFGYHVNMCYDPGVQKSNKINDPIVIEFSLQLLFSRRYGVWQHLYFDCKIVSSDHLTFLLHLTYYCKVNIYINHMIL